MKKQWFAYDPNDCPEFFETEEEAAKRACEILAQYAEYAMTDGWDELTDMICYGKVTHAAIKINETIRGEVDEDGIDGEGVYWQPDIEFKCDYEIQNLTSNSEDRITDLERRNGELEKLLAVASCPQCDGSGAVYGHDRAVCCNRPTDTGECCNNPIPEQTIEPCQFCEERHALTRTKEHATQHPQGESNEQH